MSAARQAGRPYQFLRSASINKLARAREIAARDDVDDGLIAVFGAMEPCLAVTVRGDRESGRLVPERQPRHSSPDIMRFLGHVVPAQTGRVNGRFKDELNSTYGVRPEGVRLKHRVGHNTLKVYDKHGQILRVETTLNAPEVFKIWRRPGGKKRARKSWRRLRRGVADVAPRAQVSQAANSRYLQALAATAPGRPLGEATASLTQPVRWHGQRYRALNPFAPTDGAILALINRGEFAVEGPRNADIQGALFGDEASTTKERQRRRGAAGRWLRLLRAQGLIRNIPGRHRYVLTPRGRESITALLTARQADVAQLTAFAAWRGNRCRNERSGETVTYTFD